MPAKSFKLLAIVFSLAVNNVWSMNPDDVYDSEIRKLSNVESRLLFFKDEFIPQCLDITKQLDQLIAVADCLENLPDNYPDKDLLLSKKTAKERDLKGICEQIKHGLQLMMKRYGGLWGLLGDHLIPTMQQSCSLMQENAQLKKDEDDDKKKIRSLEDSVLGLTQLIRDISQSKQQPQPKSQP